MATAETRQRPNVLITGSPGTGKSTLAEQVAETLQFDHIDVGLRSVEKAVSDWEDRERKQIVHGIRRGIPKSCARRGPSS